jgi:hypothetical protein
MLVAFPQGVATVVIEDNVAPKVCRVRADIAPTR